ncbi:MAG: prolipoprotein diacylglyceryl transferase [Synergistaceae bacterium]|nr:prolipoprotein diacylglyceryl transferase [Synergistaceae bacterium]
MYPTLFQIGSLRIDTYSVIWFIALSIAIIWSIKRLSLYGLDEYEARRVMAVSFFFMLIGARSFEYILHWRQYMNNPSLFLDINRGGVHEFGAVSGAFLSALVMCLFNRKVSFSKLCDAASPPALLAITIGRWGCFLNGCCVGLPSKFFTAVHFPFDRADVLRHPVQIYYSLIAFVIVAVLLSAERKVLPFQLRQKKHYSVISPLAVILYSLMRYSMIPVRETQPFFWEVTHSITYKGINIFLPFMIVWLLHSLLRLKSAN